VTRRQRAVQAARESGADVVVPLILTVIAFGGSFDHWVHLADAHGQRGPLAPAVAICVDLGAYMCARERQRDARLGRDRSGWTSLPTLGMVAAVVLTLAGNVASAQPTPWGVIVALVPGAFLLMAIALMERRAAETARRKHAAEAEAERQAEAERCRQAELAAEAERQAEADRQAEEARRRQAERQAELARRQAEIVTSPSMAVTSGRRLRALPAGPAAPAGQLGPVGEGVGGTVSATAVMRAYWDREVAAGRVPTGAELRDAAGLPATSSLGRQNQIKWRRELEAGQDVHAELAGARS
jgi:hypothetical protein